MLTLMQLANAVATEIQIPVPSAVVGLTDPTPRRMLRYANKAVDFVGRSADWNVLRRERIFTAGAGSVQTLAFPYDYTRMVPRTFWNRTDGQLYDGPLAPYQWQSVASNSSIQGSPVFTIMGTEIRVYPALKGTETLSFEYVSNEFVENDDGIGKQRFQVDTDRNRLDDELVILAMVMDWLAAESQPFDMPLATFRQRLAVLSAQDNPTIGTLRTTVPWTQYGNFDIVTGGYY